MKRAEAVSLILGRAFEEVGPVLSALTTFIQTKQTMPTNGGGAQNKMMMYFMPLFIGYISLTFPAGLVLYWVVMNIMQIAQQSIMNRAAAK